MSLPLEGYLFANMDWLDTSWADICTSLYMSVLVQYTITIYIYIYTPRAIHLFLLLSEDFWV